MSMTTEQRVKELYQQLPNFFLEPKIINHKNQYRIYLSEEEMAQDIGFQNHLHSFCSSRTFEAVKEDINTDYSYFFNHSHYSNRPKWAENKEYIHLWADRWANQLHYTGSILGEENPELFEKVAYKAFLNLKQILANTFPTQPFAVYLKLNYATDDETVDFGYERTPCFDLWFERNHMLQKLSQAGEGDREEYDYRVEYSQEIMRERLEQKKVGKAVGYKEPIWIREFVNANDNKEVDSKDKDNLVKTYFSSELVTSKIVVINVASSDTYKSARDDEEKNRYQLNKLRQKVLHRFRKAGITKKELAKKAGVSLHTIFGYLNGRKDMRLNNFLKICEGLGAKVEIEDSLSGDSESDKKKDTYLDLTEKVKDLFLEADITQQELAEKAGVSHVTISQYLNGQRKEICLRTFLKICEGLGAKVKIKVPEIM